MTCIHTELAQMMAHKYDAFHNPTVCMTFSTSLLLFRVFLFCLPPFPVQHHCLQGAVCPVAAASTAYCGSCDLDPSTAACTWVLSAHSETPSASRSPSADTTQETRTTVLSTRTNTDRRTSSDNLRHERSLCSSHEEVVYSGDARGNTYTGTVYV